MSTKIYNGFRFTQKDLRKVYEALHAYRRVVWADRMLAEKKFMAEQAVMFIDSHQITGVIDEQLHTGRSPARAAYSVMTARQRACKQTGLRDPCIDFEFTVVVMPHKGNNYGIVYAEQSAWVAKFMRQPWVREYAYWNNTDRPRTISERAWTQRGKVWDAILVESPGDSPAGCGMIVEFIERGGLSSPVFFKAKDLLAHVPSKQERIAWAASMYPNKKFDPSEITEQMLEERLDKDPA